MQYLAERLPLESIYNLVDLRPPTSSSNHVLPTLASANMKDTEGGESSDCAPRRRRRKGRSKTSKAKFCGLGYDSDDQNQPSRMSHSNVSTSSLASNDAITSSGVDKSVVCSYSAWDICEHLAMKVSATTFSLLSFCLVFSLSLFFVSLEKILSLHITPRAEAFQNAEGCLGCIQGS